MVLSEVVSETHNYENNRTTILPHLTDDQPTEDLAAELFFLSHHHTVLIDIATLLIPFILRHQLIFFCKCLDCIGDASSADGSSSENNDTILYYTEDIDIGTSL